MDNTELRHHCYAMGYSDGEVGAFYDGYEKGRLDAINECIKVVKKSWTCEILMALEDLKEQIYE